MDPEAPSLVGLAEASARRAAFEARPDVRAGWAAFLAFTLLSTAGFVGPFLVPWPVGAQALAALWFGGWLALFARIAWHGVAGARDDGGWALKAGPEGLLVNLRSHLNYRHPPGDAVALRLPRSQVRRLDFVRGQTSEPVYEDGVRRTRTARREWLEIETWGDVSGVQAAIDEEARRWSRSAIGSTRARHVPVTLADGRLRIAWRDAGRRLRPGLDEAEAALGRWFPTGRRLASDLTEIATLTPDEQARRIADLARAGRSVTAIALARELWGLNLTEAKQRVDALIEP